MRSLRHIRRGLALLAITLVVAQVLGAALAAAARAPTSASMMVICSVHGQMAIEIDLPDGPPVAPARHNCPCCLAGCGQVGVLPPQTLAMAYDLGAPRPEPPLPVPLTERPRTERRGGEPASPRAPPAA